MLQAGAVFAGFAIERLIGAGSLGAVYLAWHQQSGQRVALKVVGENVTADPQARTAFERAVAVAAGLVHPNIVAVQGYSDPGDPAPWLAMPFVEGVNARTVLAAAPGGLPFGQAFQLLGGAAQALDHAHSRGVLHRDVKPANLLIDQSGQVVVTDFGITRSIDGTNAAAAIAPTTAYTAPQSLANLPVDQRADVYSLGCVLFELLTGRTPFPITGQAVDVAARITAPPIALVVVEMATTSNSAAPRVNRLHMRMEMTHTPEGWKASDISDPAGTGTPDTTIAADRTSAAPAPSTGTVNLAFLDTAGTSTVETAGVGALTALLEHHAADIDKFAAGVKAVTTAEAYQKLSAMVETMASAGRSSPMDTTARIDPVAVAQLTADRAELLCGVQVTTVGPPAATENSVVLVHMQKVADRWLMSDIPSLF